MAGLVPGGGTGIRGAVWAVRPGSPGHLAAVLVGHRGERWTSGGALRGRVRAPWLGNDVDPPAGRAADAPNADRGGLSAARAADESAGGAGPEARGLNDLRGFGNAPGGDRRGDRPEPVPPTGRRSIWRAGRGHGRQSLTALTAGHGPPRRHRRAGVRRREGEQRRGRPRPGRLDQGRTGAEGCGYRDRSCPRALDGRRWQGLGACRRACLARRPSPALPAVGGDGSPAPGAAAPGVVAADGAASGHQATRWRRPEDTS